MDFDTEAVAWAFKEERKAQEDQVELRLALHVPGPPSRDGSCRLYCEAVKSRPWRISPASW